MAAKLPLEAVQWIHSLLPNRTSISVNLEYIRTQNGLDVLTVPELKMVETRLKGTANVVRKHLPASAKKSRRVHHVFSLFFENEACTIVNHRLINEIKREIPSDSKRKFTGGSTASHAASKRAHPLSTATTLPNNAQARHGTQSTSLASQKSRPPTLSSLSRPYAPTLAPYNPYSAPHYFPPSVAAMPPHYPLPSLAAHLAAHRPVPTTPKTAATTNKSKSSSKSSSGKKSKHKSTPKSSHKNSHNQHNQTSSSTYRPPAALPTSPPGPVLTVSVQNQQERSLLVSLLQAGFTNQKEILQGIRAQDNPSFDQVLMWLLEKREREARLQLELEDARQMDRARLLSEQDKEEQERMRKRNAQERLEKAKTLKDLTEIFPASWMLQGSKTKIESILASDSRAALNKLLTLEAKAKQWYGAVPKAFFISQRRKLATVTSSTCKEWLESEGEKLQQGLYELKYQQGGVPKLFLDARGKAEANDDDDVQIVGCKIGSIETPKGTFEVLEID